MNIVFESDQSFVRQLLVASGSAVYASRDGTEPITVHVLDCGIEEVAWSDYASRIVRLAERVHVKTDLVRHVIDMKMFENFGSWTNGSKATWARLLIPNLLLDVDQCVYSDCDMLFIANPIEMLEPLKNTDIFIAGHQASFCGDEKYTEAEWCCKNNLPFDAATESCSGLISMDLAAFRARHIVEKCLEFASHHLDAPVVDETTLNCVCFGHRALLPTGWGLYPWECHSFDGRIKSLHFIGGLPWLKKCFSYNPVISLKLSQEECSLWRDFELKILDLPPSTAVVPSLRLRMLASVALLCARMATLFGIKIGQARLQRTIAAYDGRSTALVTARQDLFCDR